MDITIYPQKLSGMIAAIPSKSQAHRLLICAAFADKPTTLLCPETNRDMDATADCLQALGAKITRTEAGYHVIPCGNIPTQATLPCCESGSTLRFLLPVVGALGVDATLTMEGRLPQRPLSPLWEEIERMGCILTRPTENTIRCKGKLRSGEYYIDGGVSSQFITGLMLALSLLDEESHLHITGKLQSAPYVDMTREAMSLFGITGDSFGGKRFISPGELTVEGDWSNGAFFLAAKTLGSDITVTNLNEHSTQGDRAVFEILPQLEENCVTISAADIPDLVPILSVVAAANHGTVFTDIQRLRLKESDRVASVIAMIQALGGHASATEHTLTISPAKLNGGTVDSQNDHRIAMAAAIAATVCTAPVTIIGAEAVNKSYPQFWAVYRRLGGNYEQ